MKAVDVKTTMQAVDMINRISKAETVGELIPLMNEAYCLGLENLYRAKLALLSL